MDADAGEREYPEGLNQLCDHCSKQQALLYCRADSARLCIACDRQVHSANAIFSKHSRAHLCDLCQRNPASILCASHHLLLCTNCDFESHPPAHLDRRPLEPFSGCPSATELASLFGFEGEKSLWIGSDHASGVRADMDEGLLNELVWESPSLVSMRDLVAPMEARNEGGWGFQAVRVPLPRKPSNIACGKYKEEIIQQLRNLFKAEALLDGDCRELESGPVLQYLLPDHNRLTQDAGCLNVEANPASVDIPNCEENLFQRNGGHYEANIQLSSQEHLSGTSTAKTSQMAEAHHNVSEVQSKVDDGVPNHPVIKEIASLPPKGVYELLAQDRESVISRYKEKKKARRYDKQIRYESRKTRADSRARVRGRFAKASQDDQDASTSLHSI